MANETQITVVGNLTDAPELRFTSSGTPVANFTVASTPRTFDRQANDWKDGEALFVRCAVWKEAAENVAESLTKGMRVIVQGRLKARTYQDRDGNNRTSWELEVDEVGPALKFATARVTRAQRSGGGQGGGGFGGATPDPRAGGGWGQGSQGAAFDGPNGPTKGADADPWFNARGGHPTPPQKP